MKTLLAFLFILFAYSVFGQEELVAAEMPEFNILYRGYSSKVKIVVSKFKKKQIHVSGKGLSVRVLESGEYVITPIGKERKTFLEIFVIKRKDTSLLRSIEYDVLRIPEPTFYWGKWKVGEMVDGRVPRLYARYSADIPLKASFSILKWEMTIDSTTVKSAGSSLLKAQDLLKKVIKPTLVFFKIWWRDPNGEIRIKIANWVVGKWSENKGEGMPRIYECE